MRFGRAVVGMTVTRHPMFVNADFELGGLPTDRPLAERLRASFELLPREALSERFLALLAMGSDKPPPATRLGFAIDQALAAMVAGSDAPIEARHKLRRLGVELRRHGVGPPDASRLIGTLMAALVDVAGHRWPMETIVEWAEAVTLLFEAALTKRATDSSTSSSESLPGGGATGPCEETGQ
jgi:hypothetical protein